jgi:hypothetical protein
MESVWNLNVSLHEVGSRAAVKIRRAVTHSIILAVAFVVTSLTSDTASAADPPSARQRADEIVAALKEYRASLAILLPLREREVAGANKLRAQRRELFERGIISREEFAETEAAAATAQKPCSGARRRCRST